MTCKIIQHQQKSVVLVDLSGSNQDQILAKLEEAKGIIATSAPKSALVLTNVKNTTYNSVVSNAIKNFSMSNTPFVKASAVVGADGLRRILLQTVCLLTKREIHAFDTQESAMDWLTQQ